VTDLVGNLLEMMKEGEQANPIDFAELPFDDDKLREMVLHSVLTHFGTLQREGLSAQDISTVYLISTANLVLENLVLNVRLLIAQGRPVSADSLDMQQVLARFRLNPDAN
jgi:hypothetical protein